MTRAAVTVANLALGPAAAVIVEVVPEAVPSAAAPAPPPPARAPSPAAACVATPRQPCAGDDAAGACVAYEDEVLACLAVFSVTPGARGATSLPSPAVTLFPPRGEAAGGPVMANPRPTAGAGVGTPRVLGRGKCTIKVVRKAQTVEVWPSKCPDFNKLVLYCCEKRAVSRQLWSLVRLIHSAARRYRNPNWVLNVCHAKNLPPCAALE